jgi:hypothetical protein
MTDQKATLTRPLPRGYELVSGPNGNLSIRYQTRKHDHFYSLEAWALIEKRHPKWASQHDNIFGIKA